MDDKIGKIEVFSQHFQPSTPTSAPCRHSPSSTPSSETGSSFMKFRSAMSVLNRLSLRGLKWSSGTGSQEKVQLTAAELQSLQLEIAHLEEKEAHAKAQLEHIDEILRSSCLSGYLYIRTRWAALPGEPPLLDDDADIDDWLPRYVVLHDACIFFYLFSTDLSPQDYTQLSDITEIGSLPSFKRNDEDEMHLFYILTSHGLRYECSSASKIQVDNWLKALKIDWSNVD